MSVRWMDERPEIETFGSDPETRAHVVRHLLSVIRSASRRRARRPCVGCCQECGELPPRHRLSCSHVKRWPHSDE